jgi:hypothetical protein
MTTTGSYFADRNAAQRAVQMTLPMIEPAMREPGVCGSGFLVIVVMDPALRPGDCPFDEAVLYEHTLGDRAKWDADYAAFARGKARLSWQHRIGSAELQATRAHVLREGESMLWGSVCLDGIVVAVSGAESWWDESFATAVAANLRAIAKERHAMLIKDHQLWVD